MPVNELTFVADVASWIKELLKRRTDLPYGDAKVEEKMIGGRKRPDLIVFRRGSRHVALSGEVRMPDMPYGRNHLDGELIDNAFEKALRLRSPYYFTWNVNNFALFETHQKNVPFMDRRIEDREVVEIHVSDEVNKETVQTSIREFWEELLETLARIERGERQLLNLPLDVRFIRRLDGALEEPVSLTYDELSARYRRDGAFRESLRKWMRDEQGWEISEDREALQSNLERAAKLSCYVLANRLVFYEVLRRRFPPLTSLRDTPLGTTGRELAAALNRRFLDAIDASRDYETIFGNEDLGSDLPFLSDKAVPAWARLVDGIEDFDFTRLDYDVIGRMYERLIEPEERWRYGQFFTKPDVVDLINAFCIRTPEAKVLDPACGGGTFLVRAYARKRVLGEAEGLSRSHQELLSELFGVDISAFPAQLSTINLAIRHLAAEANYPIVARKDFFEVRVGAPVTRLPIGYAAEVAGDRDVTIENLDAVIGNPPYIQQEDIPKTRKTELANLIGGEYRGPARPELSGRSDLYVYFFPHGSAFLKDGGYIGLVTSIGWLDTEYGFRLQEFFLSNFRIIAVMESQVEKWFEDARVTTAVTILQKEPEEAKRRANLVRFVQLRRPLAEIYSSALKSPISETSEAARQADMDAIRALIEDTREDETTEYWRIRLVSQAELWETGCRLRLTDRDRDTKGAEVARGYKAGKWGQYIRAPDVYFELLDRCRDRLVPLSGLADVRFGFKTGVDKFFCVRDVTEEEVRKSGGPAAFRRKWAVRLEDTKRIRIVRSGDGSLHLVEAKFLEPEFHRLTEATRIVVNAKDVGRRVINAPVSRAALRKTHLRGYVEYAEGRDPPWHEGSTVASRAKAHSWYDLGLRPKSDRAPMFWPKAQQYRHLVPWNQDRMPCKDRLFDVWPRGSVDARLLWGALNSTVVALTKTQFGRPAGIEGNLDTDVIDAQMMLVPDARGASERIAKRVVDAALRLSRRALRRYLYEEFELEDRRELDDAVLELLGIENPEERLALRDRIYTAIEEQYRATRERELVAQKDRARSKRKGTVTAADLAEEIWLSESNSLSLLEFPHDFVRTRARPQRFDLPSGKVEVGRAMLETGRHLKAGTIRVGGPSGAVYQVGSVQKCEFLQAAAECGRYGVVELPRDDEECAKAVEEFRRYCKDLEARFAPLAEQHTSDAKKQKAIAKALMRKALAWRKGR